MTDRLPTTPLDRPATRASDAAPWYLNATLSEADRAWFESALAADPQAARALAFDRRIAAALARRAEEVPADIGWDRLLREVRRAESAAPVATATAGSATPAANASTQKLAVARPVGPSGRIAAWFAGLMSPGVGLGMAAVLVAQTVAIGFLLDRPSDQATYRSSDSLRPVPVVRAIIVDSTPERLLRESLLAQGLSIAAGPDSLGQYLLVGPDGTDLQAAAQSLRNAGILASFSLDRKVMDR